MAFKKDAKRFGRDSPSRSPSSRPSYGASRAGSGGGSRPSFGGSRGGSGFGRKEFELFAADCENCGKECEVPFKPTNGKPVYCRECFKKNNDDEFAPRRSAPSSSSRGPSSDDLQEIHDKLDKIMRALKID